MTFYEPEDLANFCAAYAIVAPGLLSDHHPPGHARLCRAGAQRTHLHKEQRFSDHAPMSVDYDWKL
jgi:hypothetical protein